jgi:hypothetical protein
MSLVLRTQLSRPLTHEELDQNFQHLEIKAWTYKDYSVGQVVFYKWNAGNTVMYRCVVPHNRYVYDSIGQSFAATIGPTTYWEVISGDEDGLVNITAPTKASLASTAVADENPVKGTIATVTDDPNPENNTAYILTDLPSTNINNWLAVGPKDYFQDVSYTSGTITFTRFNGTTKSLNISTSASDYFVTGGTMTNTTLTLNLVGGQQVNIPVAQSTHDVTGIALVGSNLIVYTQSGATLIEDLNDFYLTDAQFKKGITTHDFFTMSQIHFSNSSFPLAFPSATNPPAEQIKLKTFSFADFPAKETTVVVKVVSTDPYHHIIMLPNKLEAGATTRAGTRVRFFVKQNSIYTTTKNLMLATTWMNNGLNNQLLSLMVNTKVTGLGFFLPLETMEVVDLFWDGDDWIALSTGKQEYSLFAADNYQTDVSTYINRP